MAIPTLGFLALGYYRRSWAIAVFCALLPVYLIRLKLGFPGLPEIPSTFLEVLFAAIFVPWFFGRGLRPESWAGLRRWAIPITLILTGSAIGILVSPDRLGGLGLWRAYFLEPILFFAVFTDTVRVSKDRAAVLAGMAVSLAAIALTAVFQKFTGYGIPDPWWTASVRRVTSFYGFPNAIGLYLAPIVVLVSAWAADLFFRPGGRRRPWPYLLAVVAVLGFLACLFAVSKGALIGMAVALAVYGLSVRRLRPLALTAVIAVCLAVSLYRPLTSLAGNIFAGRDASSSVRLVIWNETLNMLSDRPIFGGGLSGYRQSVEPYHRAGHIELFMYPHSLPLNLWTEIGLIGLVGFVWLLVLFFVRNIRVARRGRSWLPTALLSAMVCILIHGLVDVPYLKNDLAFQFWILVGLAESLTVYEI